ncbi:MAG: 1-(5-phosphoribosyl)-5-[(5-phosphoribosylamino)methylideneamino]imidazole-4-carboxamide isomerase [Thaumarchaeota archaeon]|nr:MAG: 1-(5-phosphoribosyl)-5-[(5-phosphoribosylamino)methylideneamino]imidazole-4-carboxamide isomerase [Nitrososphaerota archaeon]
MKNWAAIDLLKGRVVTLVKGDPSASTEWETDALETAARWQEEGADGLHLIDLDRAIGGGSNGEVIQSVLGAADVPVEVGGGIRSVEEARRWLDLGASRVVVGTMAFKNPEKLREILREVGPGRVAVAIDFKEDRVLTSGWRQIESVDVLEAVESFERLGVETVIATAVERDGTANGPDCNTYRALRGGSGMKIIASGGIRSPEDIERLSAQGLDGVIIGRALYEGTVRLAELRVS